MAKVKGVKEKVHLPLYDSISVKPGQRLGETLTSNMMRFFVDVSAKNKLQTNMQASSLLPHWKTYEVRELRVVISDLPAQFPDGPLAEIRVSCRQYQGDVEGDTDYLVTITNFGLRHLVEFKRRLKIANGVNVLLSVSELVAMGLQLVPPQTFEPRPEDQVNITYIDISHAEGVLIQNGNIRLMPLNEQIFPNDGFGTLIGKFIYNTVTTFFVGEKIMIQAPTWFFPAGAGPYSENGKVTTHGNPDPQATFRFAEPVVIDAQQNFRVEIEVPESDVLGELQRLYGPLFIWVTLDGYMTRDVQQPSGKGKDSLP